MLLTLFAAVSTLFTPQLNSQHQPALPLQSPDSSTIQFFAGGPPPPLCPTDPEVPPPDPSCQCPWGPNPDGGCACPPEQPNPPAPCYAGMAFRFNHEDIVARGKQDERPIMQDTWILAPDRSAILKRRLGTGA